MPFLAAPIIGGLIAGATFTQIALLVAFSTASHFLSRAFAPKRSGAAVRQVRETEVTGSVVPHIYILGTTKITGALLHVSASKRTLYNVHAIAAHEVDGLEEVYIKDKLAYQHGNYVSPYNPSNFEVELKSSDGDRGPLADRAIGWTTNHKFTGGSYMVSAMTQPEYDPGDSNARFWKSRDTASYIVRGAKVYDPRTGTNSYSDNWALCVGWWLINRMGYEIEDIDRDTWIESANLSDELVDGRERYTVNGSFDAALPTEDVLAQLELCGGKVVPLADRILIVADQFKLPTITITPDAVSNATEPTFNISRPLIENFNAVQGRYFNSKDRHQVAEIKEYRDALAITEDGEYIPSDIGEMIFVTDHRRARRLAKMILKRSRYSFSVSLDLSITHFPEALQIKPWDIVTLDWPDLGVVKPMRVISYAKVPGIVSVELLEDNPSIYRADIEPDALPPQKISLPDGLTVPALAGVTLTNGSSMGQDGTLLPSLRVTWDNTINPEVFIRWKKQDEENYRAQTAQGKDREFFIRNVEEGELYDVEVRGVGFYGSETEPVTLSKRIEIGYNLPTPVIAGVSQVGGFLRIVLDPLMNFPDISAADIKYTRTFGDDSLGIINESNWTRSNELETPTLITNRVNQPIVITAQIPSSARYRLFIRLVNRSLQLSPIVELGEYEINIPAVDSIQYQAWPDWIGVIEDGGIIPAPAYWLAHQKDIASNITNKEWNQLRGWPFGYHIPPRALFQHTINLDGVQSYEARLTANAYNVVTGKQDDCSNIHTRPFILFLGDGKGRVVSNSIQASFTSSLFTVSVWRSGFRSRNWVLTRLGASIRIL